VYDGRVDTDHDLSAADVPGDILGGCQSVDDVHVASSHRDFHAQRILLGRGAAQDADRPGWISIGDGV